MKNLLLPTKLAFLLSAACFALIPAAMAVDPPPDGGYPNNNTAEGEDALFNLTVRPAAPPLRSSVTMVVVGSSYNLAKGSARLFYLLERRIGEQSLS
jgi:hypothetical protein